MFLFADNVAKISVKPPIRPKNIRLIRISLMFMGRIGGLTLIFATLSANKNTLSKLPLEKITVG